MNQNKKTGAKVEISSKKPENLADLLGLVFWKEPELVHVAVGFLNHLRTWGKTDNPYKVTEWDNYCTRAKITQSQYHNMLKRLRRVGMVEKTYNKAKGVHELRVSERFSDSLGNMKNIWDDFRMGAE